MSALLSVNNVSKRFRGLVAVDRLNFQVNQGDVFAVIGPNGAGKTTLFNMIAGVFSPDGGTIALADQRINGLSPDQICRRGVGRTFQIVRPFPALSVEGNVIVAALLHRHLVADARAHAGEVLRQLDLYDKRAQRASGLTLPDRKRLEVGHRPGETHRRAVGSRARECRKLVRRQNGDGACGANVAQLR